MLIFSKVGVCFDVVAFFWVRLGSIVDEGSGSFESCCCIWGMWKPLFLYLDGISMAGLRETPAPEEEISSYKSQTPSLVPPFLSPPLLFPRRPLLSTIPSPPIHSLPDPQIQNPTKKKGIKPISLSLNPSCFPQFFPKLSISRIVLR